MTTDELLQRWGAGTITGAELRELNSRLSEPAHRNALLEDWLLESELAERLPGAASLGLGAFAQSPPERERRLSLWLSWRPLTMAAAAGLVLGIFCTSVVSAYVGPSFGKTLTLLRESFESGPAPGVEGVTKEPGKWAGDITRVVGEEQGVKPENGAKMLRFLSANYAGKTHTQGSHYSDVYRLVDVRHCRRDFADGGVVAQFSAAFNAFAFPPEENYNPVLTIYAIDASTAAGLANRPGFTLWKEALAFASHHRTQLDRDPKTWQFVTTDLRLPAETDFLFVHVAVSHSSAARNGPAFEGHYMDSVRLTLGRRAPQP